MNAAEKAFMEQVQAEVRERFNPGWRSVDRSEFCRPGLSPIEVLMLLKREGRAARRAWRLKQKPG